MSSRVRIILGGYLEMKKGRIGLLRVEHMWENSFMDVVHFLNADILKMPNGIGASYEIIYRNTI